MTSTRSAVGLALKARLEKITATNGYDHTIKKVYYDKIPMGLELVDHEMPAIFMIDEGADHRHQHQILDTSVSYRLQLVHNGDATDADLQEIQRAIGKVIYADSPSIARSSEFRFHAKVFQVDLVDDETDLHMIEANRIATLKLVVHYRTALHDM